MNKHEKFLMKANAVHGSIYSYPDEYTKSHANIHITCAIHGNFLQRPDAHIYQRQGCPQCGLLNRKHPSTKTSIDFINQAKSKWGNLYDYSNTTYKSKTTKITFLCDIHGSVEQLPNLHLKTGCQFCNGRGISKHSAFSFIKIANKIHKNKYEYDKIKFSRMNDYVTITCKQHGDFDQRAGNHIHLQNGCPQCATELRNSAGEAEVLSFAKNSFNGNIIEHDRKLLFGKEIDIYIPDLKLGIEYHGLYWHLETVRGKKHHYDKWELAEKAGIKLIQIYSNEWEEKRQIIESKLMTHFGLSTRIHGRKTTIEKLNFKESSDFLTANHLQGSDSSKIGYGLFYDDELVSCMTFGPSRFNKNYKYELLRFCNKCGLSVVGGASKLLSHFKKNHTGSIISYADKRYSNGNLYKKLGFKLDGSSHPSFSYVELKNGKIFNRMKFQKKNLVNDPHYSSDLTEYEIMKLKGFDRIWDAGQYRFVAI